MLELFLVLILVILTFYLSSALYLMLAFFVVFFLVLPGMYSLLKGAPFLPSSRKKLKVMLYFADLQNGEVLMDLGCGDGRLIRFFAKNTDAKVIGYEFSLPTYLLAKFKSVLSPKGEKVIFGNFWKVDVSDADVLVCFLLADTMHRFKKDVWPKLKPGAKLISNEFKLPGVKADREKDRVYLYVKK